MLRFIYHLVRILLIMYSWVGNRRVRRSLARRNFLNTDYKIWEVAFDIRGGEVLNDFLRSSENILYGMEINGRYCDDHISIPRYWCIKNEVKGRKKFLEYLKEVR